jgi:hypothetical protein
VAAAARATQSIVAAIDLIDLATIIATANILI